MARFDNFPYLAKRYASLTSADAFAGAFGSEIAARQLSIHDEPTTDDLPGADAARIAAAHVTGRKRLSASCMKQRVCWRSALFR